MAMSKLGKVFERDLGGSHVVEDNIGDTFHMIVARHGNDRNGQRESPRGVDGDQTIDGTLEEEPGILINQVSAVAVADDEIEISFLEEMVFDSTHDGSRITIADFGHDDADGETTLSAQ